MKLKSILMILCLFAGAGLTQLSAQNPEPEGISSWWVERTIWTPVFCDGVFHEWVSGELKAHVVEKYKDGIWVRQISQIHGEVTGYWSGVNYKFKRVGKYYPLEDKSIFQYNLKGDDGSHIVMRHIYIIEPEWSVTVVDANCN